MNNFARYIGENAELKDKKVLFEEKIYNYTDILCLYNNIQYAHLLILDLTSETNLKELFMNELTYKKYKEFEKNILEDIFFSSKGDNRFNIYLIMIIPYETTIKSKYEIQKDFQYARKLFLYENELKNYFGDNISLKRYNSNDSFTTNYDAQKILKELYQSRDTVKNLCLWQLRISLMSNYKKSRYEKLIKEMILHLSEVEKYFSNENEKRIYNKEKTKKNKREIQLEKQKLSYITMISGVKISNYRCFQECDIPFEKVNLLYGENGVGKTTILEAIELGITGQNRSGINSDRAISRVYCTDKDNRNYVLSNINRNLELSDYWYNVKSQTCKEFNELFHRFNYFDTNWVSEFAIEGKKQVNIMQMQKYLGIEKIENGKLALIGLYENLKELAELNVKTCKKIFKPGAYFFDKRTITYRQIRKETNEAIVTCNEQLIKLKNENDMISIDAIFDKHINKIENIFKLLVAANEFTSLEFRNGEIEAILNSSQSEIQMSHMSTGQKICLALSLMFSLFLSLPKAPNVVMLDEPVANLDDMHMLNLLDVLRRLAIAGTQVFFTTANPDVAKLFRRKFSFLGNDFASYRINEVDNNVKIVCERYSVYKEEAEHLEKIL